MIWLKGFIFILGLVFLYKAAKSLLIIAKEKEKKHRTKKQVLIQCTQCQTHIPQSDIVERQGKPYCHTCNEAFSEEK
jgi:formylmethanofuran dehydrogenase subunit E